MAKMMQLSCAPTAVDADGICQTQTPLAGGNLTINGALASSGTVTLGAAQLITITSAGNDSGRTFTVTGTGPTGAAQTEAITGPNTTTVTGSRYFKTVTAIAIDAASAGAITAGNAITSVSPMERPNLRENPFNIGFGVVATGTVTYTVQHTFDDPALAYTGLTWFDHDSIAAKTGSEDGNYAYPVNGIRIKVTASTAGSVAGKFIQAGI